MMRRSVPTMSVPLPRWLWVASGTRSRMRATSSPAQPASSSRTAAQEPLRARAGVDAGRLDADRPPRATGRRGGDADQRDELLRAQARDGREPLGRVAGREADFGARSPLTLAG